MADKRQLMLDMLDKLDGSLGDSAVQRASGKPVLEISICTPGEQELEDEEQSPAEDDPDLELDRRLAQASKGAVED